MHSNLAKLAVSDRLNENWFKNTPLKKAGFLFVLAPLAVLTFVLVHVIWRFTLPVPWNDESHFIIPAINFYSHHNFTADEMFVHQIFWMPVNLYIVNGAFFTLLNAFNLHLSRALSFVFVTVAAVFLRSAVKSILVSDRSNTAIGNALIAAWYVSFPIVFCADLMRPDGLSLCLSTATIALALKDRYLGAFSMALAAVLTHPLEAFPAVAVGICVLPLCSFRKASCLERVLIVWAGALFLVEGSRVTRDFTTYRLHLALQVGRKASRHIPDYTYLLAALILALLVYVVWRLFQRRQVSHLDYVSGRLLALTYSLVCVFVTAFGQEMWYFIWEVTGLTVVFALGLGWLQSPDAKKHRLPRSIASFVNKQSFVVACVIFALGLSTWTPGFRTRGVYGFYTSPDRLSEIREDQRFLRDKILDSLNKVGAKRVLLPASLYGFVIDSTDQSGNLRFSTLNVFSDISSKALDHLVLLTRGYPKAATDSTVPTALNHCMCSPIVSIATPHGYYKASIVALSAADSLSEGVKLCALLRY